MPAPESRDRGPGPEPASNAESACDRGSIGTAIYPLRGIGCLLAATSIWLVRRSQPDASPLLTWGAIGLTLLYPHIAYLCSRHLGSRREAESRNLLADMVYIALLFTLVDYRLAVALPYFIANSAANVSIRGIDLALRGLLAFACGLLGFGLLFGVDPTWQAGTLESLPGFAHLLLASHGLGLVSYRRGLALTEARQSTDAARSVPAAGVASARPAPEPAPAPPPEVLPPEVTRLAPQFDELARLLAGRSLAARACLMALRPAIAGAIADADLDQLDDAMRRLDFDGARQRLHDLTGRGGDAT